MLNQIYNLTEERKSEVWSIVNFAFKGVEKTFIRMSKSGRAYGERKQNWGVALSRTSLKTTSNHLTENCYFNAGNVPI